MTNNTYTETVDVFKSIVSTFIFFGILHFGFLEVSIFILEWAKNQDYMILFWLTAFFLPLITLFVSCYVTYLFCQFVNKVTEVRT